MKSLISTADLFYQIRLLDAYLLWQQLNFKANTVNEHLRTHSIYANNVLLS